MPRRARWTSRRRLLPRTALPRAVARAVVSRTELRSFDKGTGPRSTGTRTTGAPGRSSTPTPRPGASRSASRSPAAPRPPAAWSRRSSASRTTGSGVWGTWASGSGSAPRSAYTSAERFLIRATLSQKLTVLREVVVRPLGRGPRCGDEPAPRLPAGAAATGALLPVLHWRVPGAPSLCAAATAAGEAVPSLFATPLVESRCTEDERGTFHSKRNISRNMFVCFPMLFFVFL